MKIIIASDIHGSAKWCAELVKVVKEENADRLMLLGDILYHGPRNPLPEDYNPMKVVELLGEIKDKIQCVQGNCDAEVDLMVLPFKVFSNFALSIIDGHPFILCHGHKDYYKPKENHIYLTGHTHVPLKEVVEGCTHLNPGSVSIPKEGSGHGYILYEDKTFYFKTFDGKTFDTLKV